MSSVRNISELLPDEPMPNQLDQEILFNNAVREYILLSVLVLVLLALSHVLLSRYRRRDAPPPQPRRLRSPPLPPADDEATVDTIAMWVCTLSLSISMGAVLLLPLSILSNEMLAIYRDSPYVRWINRSFIQGLWNMMFLLSNVSLFVALPFAYLFTEAEGFPGTKKGLRSRVVETVVVLLLLVVLVMGVAAIIALLLGYYTPTTITTTIEVWGNFYLPFLYSIVSCLGVLFLLLCTPVGLGRLFSRLKNLIRGGGEGATAGEDDIYATNLEEEALWRQLRALGYEDPEQQQRQQQSQQDQQVSGPSKPQREQKHRSGKSYSLRRLFSRDNDVRSASPGRGCASLSEPSGSFKEEMKLAQNSDDEGENDTSWDRRSKSHVGMGSFLRSYSFSGFPFGSPSSASSVLPLSCSFPSSLLPVHLEVPAETGTKNPSRVQKSGSQDSVSIASEKHGKALENGRKISAMLFKVHEDSSVTFGCNLKSSESNLREKSITDIRGEGNMSPRSTRERPLRKGIRIPKQSSPKGIPKKDQKWCGDSAGEVNMSISPAGCGNKSPAHSCDLKEHLDNRSLQSSVACHNTPTPLAGQSEYSHLDQVQNFSGDSSENSYFSPAWDVSEVTDVESARRRHSISQVNGGKLSIIPVNNQRADLSPGRYESVLKKRLSASSTEDFGSTKPWQFPPAKESLLTTKSNQFLYKDAHSLASNEKLECSARKLQDNHGMFSKIFADLCPWESNTKSLDPDKSWPQPPWVRSHSVPARPLTHSTSKPSFKHASQASLESPLESYPSKEPVKAQPSKASQTVMVSQFMRPHGFPRPLHSQSPDKEALLLRVQAVLAARQRLESSSRRGILRRCLVYPLGVGVLVLITGVVVVLVVFNVLQLVAGFKSLPLYNGRAEADPSENAMLGKRAVLVWVLGPLGAVVEVVLILYLWAASLVGCYSLRPLRRVAPVGGDTPMVHLILNCALLLVMASALPLLATTLGLTNFDLLGNYASVSWLGNLWIVLSYNALFASAAVWCLLQQWGGAVGDELWDRLGAVAEAMQRRRASDGRTGMLDGLRDAFCRRLLAASQRHKRKRR